MASFTGEGNKQKAFGWAARDTPGILSPINCSRRANDDDDVAINIFCCGICHTDLHHAKHNFGMLSYPVVPGHEIVGVVTELGCGVTRFKTGDKVGVGSVVASCRDCKSCKQDNTIAQNWCSRTACGLKVPVISTSPNSR